MRWPFRRPSAESVPESSESVPEPSTPDEQAAQSTPRAAWRDLPGALPVLGTMPSATDAGFSRTLPTRWHTPPALGPLGHEVRTDVPGGLVSGAARTVDPRDTTPADLVWRTPAMSAIPVASEAAASAAAPVTRATLGTLGSRISPRPPITQTLSSTASASSLAAAEVSSRASQDGVPASPDTIQAPDAASTTEIKPLIGGQSLQRAAVPQMSASEGPNVQDHAAEASVAQTTTTQTSRTRTADLPAAARQTPLPQISVPPTIASAGTAQTRRALPVADAAVEARDPRPVPADVTDGTTAAAPAPGVTIEPDAEEPESPQGVPASEPDPLLTPRETRSGLDPLGSAPTVAPLISRTSLPRNPLTQNAQSRSALTGNAQSQGAPVPDAVLGSATPALRIPSSPVATAATPSPESTSQDTESAQTGQAASEAELETQVGAEQSVQAPGTTDAPPADTPASSSPAASAIAPLVSAATRFIPSAAPISVLQAPAAPSDQSTQIVQPTRVLPVAQAVEAVQARQPVQAAESLVGGALRSFVSPALNTATSVSDSVSQSRPSQSPVAQSVAALAPAAESLVSQSLTSQSAASQSTVSQSPSTSTVNGSSVGAAGPVSSSSASSSPAFQTEDPAALDTLARQLYGRFSRHLAGELLIDRERAQFLTDLG